MTTIGVVGLGAMGGRMPAASSPKATPSAEPTGLGRRRTL